MSNLSRVVLFFAASAFVVAPRAQAQMRTDPRWRAWLGCWASDSSAQGEQTAKARATCLVPVDGSEAVDALTIVQGQVVGRDRLDTRAPQAINRQGCQGMETATWSASGRRVYLRADYTCGDDVRGATTTVFAISTTGEWLRVDEVRSAGGALASVARRHAIGLVAGVPQVAAASINERLLAINTARAAAAAPIKLDEIVDALHSLDAGVVRSWIVASEQRFLLNGSELAGLAGGDVPPSVLQAIMGASAAADRGVVSAASNTGTAAVLNAPAYAAYPPVGVYLDQPLMSQCPPTGCYQPQQPSPNYEIGNPYYGASPYSYYPYPNYYPASVLVRRGSAFGLGNRQLGFQRPFASQPVGVRGPPLRPEVRSVPAPPPRAPVARRRP